MSSLTCWTLAAEKGAWCKIYDIENECKTSVERSVSVVVERSLILLTAKFDNISALVSNAPLLNCTPGKRSGVKLLKDSVEGPAWTIAGIS